MTTVGTGGRGLLGRDLGPAVGGGVEFPDGAIGHAVGAGLVGIRHEERAVAAERGAGRAETLRLTGHGRPGAAGIDAPVEPACGSRDSGIDCGGRLAGVAGLRDKFHPDDADGLREIVVALATFLSRLRSAVQHAVVGYIGETRDALPGGAVIGAAPESGVARAEVENVARLRIDRETLAGAAAGLVAAKLHRDGRAFPSAPAVGRAEDRAVTHVRMRVSAGGEIDALRVGGIEGEALDALEVPIVAPEPVEQRLPGAAGAIPAIGAADIGARVRHAGRRRVKLDARDKAAAADGHATPRVRLGADRYSGQTRCGEQCRAKTEEREGA